MMLHHDNTKIPMHESDLCEDAIKVITIKIGINILSWISFRITKDTSYTARKVFIPVDYTQRTTLVVLCFRHLIGLFPSYSHLHII